MRKDVGVSPASVVGLNRFLTKANSKLAANLKKSTDEVVEKFLTCIVEPASLASEAQKLLQADKVNLPATLYDQPQPALIAGGAAVPGGWKRKEVVEFIDGLWHACWRRKELTCSS